MSYLASATSFNLGIDRTVQLVDQNGNTYSFASLPTSSGVVGRLISFESKPDTDKVDNGAISDGGMVEAMIEHKSWSGTMTVDRRNANLDNLWATLEQAYHSGQPQVKFNLHEATVSRDGSNTAYFRCNNAVIWLEDAGTFALGSRTELKIGFQATTRVPE